MGKRGSMMAGRGGKEQAGIVDIRVVAVVVGNGGQSSGQLIFAGLREAKVVPDMHLLHLPCDSGAARVI